MGYEDCDSNMFCFMYMFNTCLLQLEPATHSRTGNDDLSLSCPLDGLLYPQIIRLEVPLIPRTCCGSSSASFLAASSGPPLSNSFGQ